MRARVIAEMACSLEWNITHLKIIFHQEFSFYVQLFFLTVGDFMIYSLLILVSLFSALLLLFLVEFTHVVWYSKLRRWVWHRRLISKIEKRINKGQK